jgi:rubrerythrin
MKCDIKEGKNRICPQCGLEVKDPKAIRCPRCFKILLKSCSECKGCSLR